MLRTVRVAPRSLTSYVDEVGEEAVEQLREAAEPLRGARVLHLNSTSHPHIRDGVAELGLTTDLTGEATQESQLYLQVSTGQVVRHVGDVRLRTTSKTTLELPEGPQVFDIQADFDISFDVLLTRLNGEPMTASCVTH